MWHDSELILYVLQLKLIIVNTALQHAIVLLEPMYIYISHQNKTFNIHLLNISSQHYIV
jgi:hypothetical protein